MNHVSLQTSRPCIFYVEKLRQENQRYQPDWQQIQAR